MQQHIEELVRIFKEQGEAACLSRFNQIIKADHLKVFEALALRDKLAKRLGRK